MPPLNEGVDPLHADRAARHVESRGRRACSRRWTASSRSSPRSRACSARTAAPRRATDPAPLGMVEVTVVLKPRDAVAAGHDLGRPDRGDGREAPFPGMPNVWWMPIQTRTEMLVDRRAQPARHRGVRRRPRRASRRRRSRSSSAVAKVPGTRSAFAERSTGGFYIDFDVKREEAARHGLTVADVNDGRRRRRSAARTSPRPSRAASATRSTCATRASSATTPSCSAACSSPRRPARRSRCRRSPTIKTRARPADDPQRGRQARRLRVRRHRPPDRRLRRRRQARRRARRRSCPPGTRLAWVGQFKYFERAKERLEVGRSRSRSRSCSCCST